jgi:hypothetical protein
MKAKLDADPAKAGSIAFCAVVAEYNVADVADVPLTKGTICVIPPPPV